MEIFGKTIWKLPLRPRLLVPIHGGQWANRNSQDEQLHWPSFSSYILMHGKLGVCSVIQEMVEEFF